MILLDSNVLIDAFRPENTPLRRQVAVSVPVVSAVTYVETLGYHRLSEQERIFLEAFFSEVTILGLTAKVLDEAVRLRQIRRMSLGDALIAATALVHQLALATRNVKDFQWIEGLAIVDLPDVEPSL